jgi:hypothetical protein
LLSWCLLISERLFLLEHSKVSFSSLYIRGSFDDASEYGAFTELQRPRNMRTLRH